MKVAIDSSPLTSGHAVRGIGAHTRELIGGLNALRDKGLTIDAFDFSLNKNKLTNGKYDIVHYSYFHPHFVTLPTSKLGKKVIVTIHDVIRLIYPDKYPPGLRGNIRFLLQKSLLKNVDRIITISETSKKDICRFLDLPPEKVSVVYLAPRTIFRRIDNTLDLEGIKKKYNLPDKFVLYVGDVNYNKNIPTLLSACKIAKLSLVIVGKQAKEIEGLTLDLRHLKGPQDWVRFIFGKPHPELAHLTRLSEKFNKEKNIIRLGFLPDKDLVGIFNLATLYCQPSYYEGFGLSFLEAMASETPIVASKVQVHVEIAGNAALFVDPRSSKDMADNFLKIVKDKKLRNSLRKLGLLRVKKFSWEKTAQETIKVYEKVLDG